MTKISDVIEKFINELLSDTKNTELIIKRNELANHFSCVPSQINYVLTTRFTKERGYYIESKRGGGGYIKIRKFKYKCHNSLKEALYEKIRDSITYNSGVKIVKTLIESRLISEREGNIIKATINDRTIILSGNLMNKQRAELLKAVIISILE